MRSFLVAASAAFSVAAAVPYTVDVIRGRDKPAVASWLIWAAILAVGSTAALDAGQVPAAVYGLACAAECALVAVLAIRQGNLSFGRLDGSCLCGAAAGLVLLAAVRDPAMAVAVTIAADLLAYLPTMAHAWRRPDEETASAYALYAAGAGLALAAAGSHEFMAVAYPAYLAVTGAGVAVMIAVRRAAGRAGGRCPAPGAPLYLTGSGWRYREAKDWMRT